MKDQREEKKVKQKGVGVFKIIWNIISRLLTVLIIIICLIIGVQKVIKNHFLDIEYSEYKQEV